MPNPSKVTYSEAREIETIAKKLIPKHHSHLREVKLAYLFRDRPINKSGKSVVASAEKCNGKTKFLSNYSFIITTHQEIWDMLTDKQKTAVIDHELNHCKTEEDDEGEINCKIISHDIDDFIQIFERHGAYSQDLQAMINAIEKSKKKKS